MKTPIAAIKHPADSRTNIPTEELRDFVAEDEDHPKVMALRARPQPGPATDVGRQSQSGHVAADAAYAEKRRMILSYKAITYDQHPAFQA